MKSFALLASLLFGLSAVAAPVDKRALIVQTEVVIETVYITSTVFEGDQPSTAPSPSPSPYQAAEFYGKPNKVDAKPTYAQPAPVAPQPSSSSSAAPAPEKPTPVPTSSAYVAPPPAPEPAKPTSSAAPAYVPPSPAPEPAKPSPAPEAPTYAAPASGGSSSSGESYSNVDITIYQTADAAGACGDILHDTDMIVAIAQPAWGASTYDTMTGNATNRWCRKKVEIEYKGNKVQAQIMDMCPGCSGHDLDLSPAVWKKLTGSDEMTRYKASWTLLN